MGRVVVATDVPPLLSYANGYSARLYHFLLALAEKHEVYLIALYNDELGPKASAFDPIREVVTDVRKVEVGLSVLRRKTRMGRLSRYLHYLADATPYMSHPRQLPLLRTTLKEVDPQLLILYLPNLAHLLLRLDIPPPALLLLEEGWERAVPSAIGRTDYLSRLLIVQREMKRVSRMYSRAAARSIGVVAISEEEGHWFGRSISPDLIRIFGHGLDVEYFSPQEAKPAEIVTDVCVIADFSQERNVRSLRRIFEDMRSTSTLAGTDWAFVGKDSESVGDILRPLWANHIRLNATGYVADVRPHYASSRVILVPDFEGTGVKTTVLQGWAMRRPVVASVAATRGLPATAEQNLLVGDGPSDICAQLERVLGDPGLAERIAVDGRRTVVSQCDIRQIADSFAAYCGEAMRKGRQ